MPLSKKSAFYLYLAESRLTVANGLTVPSLSTAATPTTHSKALPVSMANDPASPVRVILDLRSGRPLMPETVKAEPDAGMVPRVASLVELNSTLVEGDSLSSAVPHPQRESVSRLSTHRTGLTGVVAIVHAKIPGFIPSQSCRVKHVAVDWTFGRATRHFRSFTEECIILELLSFREFVDEINIVCSHF